MFKPVDNRQSFPKLEEEVLALLEGERHLPQERRERPEDKLYVFYEGPPTANARPGVHHVLARVFKDLFPRYKTMRGYRVAAQGRLGHARPARRARGRARARPQDASRRSRSTASRSSTGDAGRASSATCRSGTRLTERIAFWVDLRRRVRHLRQRLHRERAGGSSSSSGTTACVYQDYRSTPHCPRCGTSLCATPRWRWATRTTRRTRASS